MCARALWRRSLVRDPSADEITTSLALLPERTDTAALPGDVLVAAAFVLVNLGDMAISMSYQSYGFPLTYRSQYNRLPGVDGFHPGALSLDIALAAVAIASTFVATRRWSRLIGRCQ